MVNLWIIVSQPKSLLNQPKECIFSSPKTPLQQTLQAHPFEGVKVAYWILIPWAIKTSSQSETITSPQLPLMEVTIQTRTS